MDKLDVMMSYRDETKLEEMGYTTRILSDKGRIAMK